MHNFKMYEKLGVMPPSKALVVFLVMCSIVGIGFPRLAKSQQQENGTRSSHLIEFLCNKTLYFEVCNSSLSAYPGALQATNMSELVRIAVELSHDEAQQVADYTLDVNGTSPGSRTALEDCVEVLDDMVDELCSSLAVVAEPDWKQRVDDVKTWLSAALTDTSTCAEGFEDEDAEMPSCLKEKLDYLKQLTSNALAIVNYVSETWKWEWLPSLF